MIMEVKSKLIVSNGILKAFSEMAGIPERQILYQINDHAMELSTKLMSEGHLSNWTSKTFTILDIPFKLKMKAKYNRYDKDRSISCTLSLANSGKGTTYDVEKLLTEVVESKVLIGD